MTDFERLIPVDEPEDSDRTGRTVTRSSSFTRASLARFSLQRLRRRGWTVGVDDQDKENAADGAPVNPTVPGKRVKFNERVYHGPVRSKTAAVGFPVYRGILKTSSAASRTAIANSGHSPVDVRRVGGCGGVVPDRMRMYAMPVTSFYIGAHDDEPCPQPPPGTVKRSSVTAAGASHQSKKVRRFGTEIGS